MLVRSVLLSLLLSLSPVLFAADLQTEGRQLLSQGDAAAASKKFAEAAKVNPFDASALNNQAVALSAQGDYEKALGLLERAVRLAPARADIATNLNEMRAWVTRHAPQIKLKEAPPPIMNVYPDTDIPPEPPALWKK
ncbi:tetratricopeptide repeat protein [Undibacterium rugosum]|uniref:Tetratricopeptide repeat protein n=1 Tax=Undibacterium rugosum TaxID=2762291 RepID=A0A923I3J7_9BURK|nr:tetratricopeptide repeat protein [Undibacterium rugosum]MBC3936467.1 tetratricopeptide repeat protein [Undibacterium rugosum]MBR7779491.1 tetratricopeptide repeat protein [Undibacterium rugosum]